LLYRNESIAPRVAVRLQGRGGNTRGIGARVTLRDGAVPVQSQEMISGGRYLSNDDAMRVFAAGTNSGSMSLEVLWRSGHRSLVPGVQANHLYVIHEPASEAPSPSPTQPSDPWFAEVELGHVHVDPPFDDFQRQPLLPHMLSQLGPGVSWYDIDGNGRDELIVGSGQSGRLSVWRYDSKTGFSEAREPALRFVADRDQTTVLGWQRFPGQRGLLIGVSNYEDGLPEGAAVRLTDPVAKSLSDVLATQSSSTGPMALADWDGDGDLDLFVGGRVIPGRFPEAASSWLLVNEGGDYPTGSIQVLEDCGMVSGAIWTDLTGDGFPELCAC
jgi:enediyne biosynthesis protein E4